MNSRRLHNVFGAYTGGSTSLTSVKFLKMMKDASLLDQSLQQSDVDLIFTKCKEKGQRTLNYDGFKKALEMVAAKKQVSSTDFAEFIILKCGEGPSLTGVTQTQEIRFYDDKSSYTGVHKVGGPTIVDKEKLQLNQLLDRTAADVRGLKPSMKQSYYRDVSSPTWKQTTSSSSGRRNSGHKNFGSPLVPPSNTPHQESPQNSFMPPPIPNQQQQYHSPHAGFDQEAMLGSLENRLRRSSLSSSMGSEHNQPHVSHSVPHNVQGHNYDSPYSQSSRHPPQNDGPHDYAQQTLNVHHMSPTSDDHFRHQQQQQYMSQQSPQPQYQHDQPHPVDKEKQLFKVYRIFCADMKSAEMDSTKFVKLCKDVGFIGPRNHMTVTDADLIFQRTKRTGNYGKRICYEDFRMVAIPEMAKRMKCRPDDVIAHIIRSEGPTLNNVTMAADVRFHDDKNTYTGVKGTTGGVNPSFAVGGQGVTMEDLLDRSQADYRGVKIDPQSGQTQSIPHQNHGNSGHQHPQHHNVVMPGEANRKGGVYDRLTDQGAYTGYYKERFNPNSSSEGYYDMSQVVQRR